MLTGRKFNVWGVIARDKTQPQSPPVTLIRLLLWLPLPSHIQEVFRYFSIQRFSYE